MADWSELDRDLLLEIAGRMMWYEDLRAFRMVCTSWRSAASFESKKLTCRSNQVPCLMLAPQENTDSREFFTLFDGAIHRLVLPEITTNKCLSSRGWILYHSSEGEVGLIHPLSRVQFKLPHLKTLYDRKERDYFRYAHFVKKFVLSSSPSVDSDFVVLILYGKMRRLACFRANEEAWVKFDPYYDESCSEIVYHKGKFYASTFTYKVAVIEWDESYLTIKKNIASFPYGLIGKHDRIPYVVDHITYLVESAGELLFVIRKYIDMSTFDFQVYQVDLDHNTWTEVNDLGNRGLFLGCNSSYSVDFDEFPYDYETNCIYFTDDYWNRTGWGPYYNGRDMGVYNMKYGTIKPHFRGRSLSYINPPIWVEQNF